MAEEAPNWVSSVVMLLSSSFNIVRLLRFANQYATRIKNVMNAFLGDSSEKWKAFFSPEPEYDPAHALADSMYSELANRLFNPVRNPAGNSKAANAIFLTEENLRAANEMKTNRQNPDWKDPTLAIHPTTTDNHDELQVNLTAMQTIKQAEEALELAYKSPDLTESERRYFFLRERLQENPAMSVAEAFNERGRALAESKFGYTLPLGVVAELQTIELKASNKAALLAAAETDCGDHSILGSLIPAAFSSTDCKNRTR